jgi:hypothetical protein
MTRRNSIKAVIALALVASISFLWPARTEACGPFFTDAIFVFTKHPDFPLEQFASGKLGVVDAGWARSYLVVAYRHLSGASLNGTEAKGIKSLWDDRLNFGWASNDDAWTRKWNEARSKVPGTTPVQISVYRNREKPHEYESYLNCQEDAFETAGATLTERISKFGADSAQVRAWLTAQDTVFSNCGEGSHLPDAAAASDDQLLRADRAYQIAAANFYTTNLDVAKEQFDAITKDKSSPWREKAAYLAARAMLRKGSFADKEDEARPSLADAEDRLNSILKDNSLKSVHGAAARLLNLVRLRLHPEAKVHELAHSIMKPNASSDFKQDVWDYTVLLDKYLETGDETTAKPLASGLQADELTDWIVTLEKDYPQSSSHAIERWEKTKALPWLVAAISNAGGQDAKSAALLTAAAQVNSDSPAFPSLTYHSVRLLVESNQPDKARALADKVLANDRAKLNASAVNLLLAQRLKLSQNLDEFLTSAQRIPAGLSDDNDGREIPEEGDQVKEITRGSQYFFDRDAARIFNKGMPVSIIGNAARSKILAANLRRDVAQAAFARAALLDEKETADQAAVLLREMYPQLREFLDAYQKSTTPDARRFAHAFLSLKFPGIKPYVTVGVGRSTPLNEIDSYRDNYWCDEPPTSTAYAANESTDAKPTAKPLTPPEFLKASQTLATRQANAIHGLGTGPDYLCRIAIEWTEKNPNDPRAPEALHLAVRSTRYGCTDKDTGRWSKAAYDLLHQRYPNTVWARNTKYWFK